MSSEATSKYLMEVRLLPIIEQYKNSNGKIDFNNVPIDEIIFLEIDRVRRLDNTIQIQEYFSNMKGLYHHPLIKGFRQELYLYAKCVTSNSRKEITRYKNEKAIQSIKKIPGLLGYLLKKHKHIPHV